MRLNSNEIIKLLDNLIGRTEAIGDTIVDAKSLENLKTLIEVTNWCLDRIMQSSETCSASEYSKHLVGLHARCAMDEYTKWLEERLEI